MFKAVLFDMDGVIIDSEPLHAKAFQDSMRPYGLNLSDRYCYQFIGNTDRYMAEVLIKEHNLAISVEELLRVKNEAKLKLEEEVGYPPVPYVKELVQDLYTHKIKLAIASSSPMDAIKKTAETLGIETFFSDFISGMDLEKSKPAPDIFLKAAAHLGVAPEDCLVIEDSTNGITAAKAANMTCVAFFNPHSGKQNLEKADIIVEGFEEIDTVFLNNVYQRAHNLPITIAETEHMILRELSMADMTALYDLYQNDAIRPYISNLGDYNTEAKKLKAYIKNIYHFYNFGTWGVFDSSTNQLIGRCGLEYNKIGNQTEMELSYLLLPSYQGRGLAFESASAAIKYGQTQLGCDRIVAAIEPDNHRSIQLALHLSMHPEKEVDYRGRHCILYVLN